MKQVKRAFLDAVVNLNVTNQLVEAVKEKTVNMKLVDGEQDRTAQQANFALLFHLRLYSVYFCRY